MFRLNPTPKLNVPLSFAKGRVTAAGQSMALPLRLAKWQQIDFQPALPISPFPFPAFYCVIQALSKCVTKHTSNALKTCFCSSQHVIQCKNHLNCTDCSRLGNAPEQTKREFKLLSTFLQLHAENRLLSTLKHLGELLRPLLKCERHSNSRSGPKISRNFMSNQYHCDRKIFKTGQVADHSRKN